MVWSFSEESLSIFSPCSALTTISCWKKGSLSNIWAVLTKIQQNCCDSAPLTDRARKNCRPVVRDKVDLPVGQVTFHSHLPNGQGPRQVICQLNCKKSNLRLSQGKQNLRATCPKGKLEFKFFSSPDRVSDFVSAFVTYWTQSDQVCSSKSNMTLLSDFCFVVKTLPCLFPNWWCHVFWNFLVTLQAAIVYSNFSSIIHVNWLNANAMRLKKLEILWS